MKASRSKSCKLWLPNYSKLRPSSTPCNSVQTHKEAWRPGGLETLPAFVFLAQRKSLSTGRILWHTIGEFDDLSKGTTKCNHTEGQKPHLESRITCVQKGPRGEQSPSALRIPPVEYATLIPVSDETDTNTRRAGVAQLEERRTRNADVVSSSLTLGSTFPAPRPSVAATSAA